MKHLCTILSRSIQKRCPRCGKGSLFSHWITFNSKCSQCDWNLAQHPGDQWGFLLILDRVFLLGLIVLIYFRWAPDHTGLRVVLFSLVGLLFIVTMPHRIALCYGLEFFFSGNKPRSIDQGPL